MSIQAINWAISFEADNATEKSVLFVLANYADGDGICHPGQQNIAKQAACSERSVRRVLDGLEGRGVIRREVRRRKDGSRTSDIIVLHAFQQAANLSVSKPDTVTGSDEANRPICQNLPDTVTGLTTFEPPVEPSDNILSGTGPDHGLASPKRKAYPDDFEAFWQAYPRTPNMSKKEAFDAWRKLDQSDRLSCIASITGYVAFLKTKPDLETIHACRFIKYRRFEGFAPSSSSTPAGEATDDDWRKRLRYGRQNRQWWTAKWGPPPGRDGCAVPVQMIMDGDGDDWSEWAADQGCRPVRAGAGQGRGAA